MIQSQTPEPESSGTAIDGLSLQDAYLLFLEMDFPNPDLPRVEGPGPLILTRDASEALSRVEKRHGVIERHPDLMVADDDWEGVAMRLTVTGAIDVDAARDDILVHRLFWKLFEDGKWTMTGRPANVAADERIIEPRLFRYFRIFRLRQSIIDDGEADPARFVDVRVYSAPRACSEAADLLAAEDEKEFYDRAGHRQIGVIVFEDKLDLALFYDHVGDFLQKIELGYAAHAALQEKDFQPVTEDALKESERLRGQCRRFLKAARERGLMRILTKP
jgi:hypothetical protein